MPAYSVHVTIENKPGIADPEGTTILNDLVLRGNFSSVSQVRTAKMLKFVIREKDRAGAERKIRELCDELRIFNPLVSRAAYKVQGPQRSNSVSPDASIQIK